ncbi:MAG: hypothetical protein UY01_C0016G0015 [Candidatus Nomurabacteria bacterium GW2011_GWB1_47_6]|uniref:Uncharacterized protein n=1 Tax=Candidatus Nomurabacteria bacterium GW2011_GWB1_47_6 TaxID=1618749 RepID=A0A0G1VZ11_9BACT|nr:MAG: hypothetical protein UY01_C0016G0015 [Candidatus Nomurabacteria bacterium GW2011_GWB1_47_6]
MSILGFLVLAAIVILVLSYFNISIKTVVESPAGQENIEYVKGGSKSLWDEYLEEPVSYLWNDIWVKLFWRPFVDNMERLRDGRPTDIDKAGANLQINY